MLSQVKMFVKIDKKKILYPGSLLLQKKKLSRPIIVLRKVLCYVVMMEKLLISGDK